MALLSSAEETSLARPDAVKMLAALHASGDGLSRKAGEAFLKEVYEDRKKWRDTSAIMQEALLATSPS